MSFFDLTPPRPRHDHPGISADEATWDELCEALREALNACQERHPGLTWGDVIHAAKFLAHDLIQSYHDDSADA